MAELAASGLVVLADKGYAGAGEHIRAPYRGRNKPASQKDAEVPDCLVDEAHQLVFVPVLSLGSDDWGGISDR